MKLTFPFETLPRVKYRTNPLVEVICQFRFPKLLRIESEVPAAFQEAIKSDFPLLEEKNSHSVTVQLSGSTLQTPIQNQPVVKLYDFLSDDRNWRVGLNSSTISLSCQRYEEWKEFRKSLSTIFKVFTKIYDPPYFTRCGLRYINVIDPFMLGLQNSKFSELISARLIGEQNKIILGSDNTKEFVGSYSVGLGVEHHFLRVNYGLLEHPTENKPGFKIDGDFWVEGKLGTNHNVIFASLDEFNGGAGSLFRCSIEDKVFIALGPDKS